MNKTELMDVWRLEDADGFGIYNAGPGRSYLQMATYEDPSFSDYDWQAMVREHIAPSEDAALCWRDLPDRGFFIFGFADLEQYKAWVFKDAWRASLAEMGVRLNHYKVERDFCRYGEAQAIFRRDHAVLVETVSPDQIH